MKRRARDKDDRESRRSARERYAEAARLYGEVLERYPDDEDALRWRYFYAQSLHYSGRYDRAYEQYREVRETEDPESEFRADAGFKAVEVLEFRLKELAEAGEFEGHRLPFESDTEYVEELGADASEEGEDRSDVEEEPMPEAVQKYVRAMMRYVELGLNYGEESNHAPKFLIDAGRIYYDYNHFEAARKVLERLVEDHSDREEAYFAMRLILESYRREKRYGKMAESADRLAKYLDDEWLMDPDGDDVSGEPELVAKFRGAEMLFRQGKYEKAARKFQQIVEEEPDHEYAPRALNNAAVAYEELKKRRTAARAYRRLYDEYPSHPLAPYALYRTGINYEGSFEFRKAIQTYMAFYEKYEGETHEQLRKMGFDLDGKRPKALMSAGVLARNLGLFPKAAERFERFAESFPDHESAAQAQFQAVASWKKSGRKQRMMEAMEVFRKEYGSDRSSLAQLLEGLTWVAEFHAEKGREQLSPCTVIEGDHCTKNEGRAFPQKA